MIIPLAYYGDLMYLYIIQPYFRCAPSAPHGHAPSRMGAWAGPICVCTVYDCRKHTHTHIHIFACKHIYGNCREPDGVTPCYPILQDGRTNRWQINTGWYGKMQEVSMYPSGPMNGQNIQLWRHTFAKWLIVSWSEILRHERNAQDGVTPHFAQSIMGYHSWKDVVTLRPLTSLLIVVAVLLCSFQVQPPFSYGLTWAFYLYNGPHNDLVQQRS